MQRKLIQVTCIIAANCAVAGCATITQGWNQNVAISSSPSGARCQLTQDGETIAMIATPAVVHVRKTKDPILVNCSAPGFAPASQFLGSGIALGTYGNYALGGVVGWGIDSAIGSDNEYPRGVNINLQPLSSVRLLPSPMVSQDYPLSSLSPGQIPVQIAPSPMVSQGYAPAILSSAPLPPQTPAVQPSQVWTYYEWRRDHPELH